MCQINYFDESKMHTSKAGEEPVFYKVLIALSDGRFRTPYYGFPAEMNTLYGRDCLGLGGGAVMSEGFKKNSAERLKELGFEDFENRAILLTMNEGYHLFRNRQDAESVAECYGREMMAFHPAGSRCIVAEAKVPAGFEYWYGKAPVADGLYDSVCAKGVIYDLIEE